MQASEELFQDYTVATPVERYAIWTYILPMQVLQAIFLRLLYIGTPFFPLCEIPDQMCLPFGRFTASIEEAISSWTNAGMKPSRTDTSRHSL